MTRAGLKREEGSIQEGLKSDGDSECDGTNPVHYYYPWFSPINLSSIGPDRARFDGGGQENGSKARRPVIPLFWVMKGRGGLTSGARGRTRSATRGC